MIWYWTFLCITLYGTCVANSSSTSDPKPYETLKNLNHDELICANNIIFVIKQNYYCGKMIECFKKDDKDCIKLVGCLKSKKHQYNNNEEKYTDDDSLSLDMKFTKKLGNKDELEKYKKAKEFINRIYTYTPEFKHDINFYVDSVSDSFDSSYYPVKNFDKKKKKKFYYDDSSDSSYYPVKNFDKKKNEKKFHYYDFFDSNVYIDEIFEIDTNYNKKNSKLRLSESEKIDIEEKEHYKNDPMEMVLVDKKSYNDGKLKLCRVPRGHKEVLKFCIVIRMIQKTPGNIKNKQCHLK